MLRSSSRPRGFTGAAMLALLLLAGAAFVLPQGSRNPLVETTVWSLVLMSSFAGWGSLMRHVVARDEPLDLGLRVAWGASFVCFLGALLMVVSLMNRAVAFALVESGVVLAVAALARERLVLGRRVRLLGRAARREPLLALVVAFVAALVALHLVAAIADWQTHPYDDDIAYLAFVKKLRDTGTLVEPFSVRRLSSLGGQTFFQELVSLRAEPNQANAFDRGICVVLVVLLVVGHRAGGRRPPVLLTIAIVFLFLSLQKIATNTASCYSGALFFLAMFRTLVWGGARPRAPWKSAVPLALVVAALCSLRQNYSAVAVLTLAASYGFQVHASSGPLRARVVRALWAAAATCVALTPWLIVSWQSNRTPFYPLFLGTANPALLFDGSGMTAAREGELMMRTAIEGIPIIGFVAVVIAWALVREDDPSRPLTALALGTMGGFVAVVHSLTQSDFENIARYTFGSVVAFALAVALVAGTERGRGLPRGRLAIALVVLAVLVQGVDARAKLPKFYGRALRNIDVAWHARPRSAQTEPVSAGLYWRLQHAVPAGARMAVMLDEPHYLDFARNRIMNLDMPGYSSPSPGMPYFQGDEPIERYLRSLGIRYLAYVRQPYSRYQYRRDYWLENLMNEQEMWRNHAPYVIDLIDAFDAIQRRHGLLFEERGLAVVDLDAP